MWVFVMAAARLCWLVKSEADCFSIDDLAKAPKQTAPWSGVRNYQARNFMRDQMKLGDRVLYYHSSGKTPAVVGTAVVAREAYPDPTAWDKRDDHYDAKASPTNPIWQMVDIKLAEIFARPVTITELRSVKALAKMELLKQGSRLSVQPVRPEEFETIVKLGRTKSAATPAPPVTAKTKSKAATTAKANKKSKTR